MPSPSPLRRWLPSLAWLAVISSIVWMADRRLARPLFQAAEFAPYADKFYHFLGFGTMAFFLNLSLRGRCWRFLGLPLPVGSVMVALVCTVEEFSQKWFPWRTFDYYDLAADYAGILFFGSAAIFILRRKRNFELSPPAPHC